MPDYLTLSREWMKLLGKLPTETARWNVLAAAANYAFDGKEPRGLSDEEKAAYKTIRRTIKTRRRNERSYAKKRMNHTFLSLKRMNHAVAYESCDSEVKRMNHAVVDSLPYQDKDLNLKTHTKGAPAREEVQKYSEEVGRPDEADRFFDYYESNGWTCSNGQPLVDWRAAFRYWINGKGKRTKKPEKPKRDYTGI